MTTGWGQAMGHHTSSKTPPSARRRGRADHLERHGTGWRVRIRRPKALVPCIVPKTIRITIGAVPYAVAARAARAVRVSADRLFAEVVGMDEVQARERLATWRAEMNREVAARLVETGNVYLSAEEAARLRTLAETPDDDPALEMDMLLRMAAQTGAGPDLLVRRALAGDRRARADLEPVLDDGLRALGVAREPGTATAYAPMIFRAWLQAMTERAKIEAGDPDAVASALSAIRSLSEAAPIPQPVLQDPAFCRSSTNEPLLARWDDFVRAKVDIRREWKRSRLPELAATRSVFEWLCGKVELDSFGRGVLVEWQNAYLRLPCDYSENAAYRSMTVEQLIDWSRNRDRNNALNAEQREGYKRISAKSFNKHLSSLKAYITWLISCECLPPAAMECFKGLHVSTRRGKKSREERLRYKDDQVQAFFSSPLYMGRKSARFLTQRGPLVIRVKRHLLLRDMATPSLTN